MLAAPLLGETSVLGTLAEAVKSRCPRVRVGVVTGWGDVPEAEASPREVVNFILSKPLTLEALDEAIGRADVLRSR